MRAADITIGSNYRVRRDEEVVPARIVARAREGWWAEPENGARFAVRTAAQVHEPILGKESRMSRDRIEDTEEQDSVDFDEEELEELEEGEDEDDSPIEEEEDEEDEEDEDEEQEDEEDDEENESTTASAPEPASGEGVVDPSDPGVIRGKSGVVLRFVQKQDADKCGVRQCNGAAALTYLGHGCCQKHWAALSGSEVTKQQKKEKLVETAKTNRAKTGGKGPSKAKTGGKTASKAAAAAKNPTTKPEATKPRGAKPRGGKMSALDAAAVVLRKSKRPMRVKEIIEAMANQGLWESPGGKTPHATLNAAILRDISLKGKESRFAKPDRGLFTFAGE